MQWLNEPPVWAHEDGTITFTCAPKTDFWRITHDDGQRHNGHFYYQPVTGDFVADVKFSGDYTGRYDHAGLMVALDDHHWMKCGVEYFDDTQHVSVVVTRDFSDWSIVPLSDPPSALWMRVKREGNTLEVAYSLDGDTYLMLRQAYFPTEATVQIGVMACAPLGDGFPARFEGFGVRALARTE